MTNLVIERSWKYGSYESSMKQRTLNGGSKEPPETSNPDRISTTHPVRDRAGSERSNNRTSCKSRADSALNDAMRVVKVINILVGADNC
jgi:hypothetical protein